MTIAAYERALPSGRPENVRARIPFDQIVSIMRQRRSQQAALISQMIEARDRYNGDVVLPLPTVEGGRELDPPVPRLIAQAIDGTAMRAASPDPTIVVPALKATQGAMDRADTRRKVLYARWHANRLRLKLYRAYRHLVGYGTCCFVVMPAEDGSACIELRDPLTCYPELRSPDDVRPPRNVGNVYGRSIDWIVATYPEANEFFYNAAGLNWDTLWDLVEWIDETEIVVGILGPRMPAYGPNDSRPYGYNGFELRRWRNPAGMVPVAVPQRLTLDRIMGQMATMVPTVDLHARLMALQVVAAEKHVFQDLVILSEPNQTAQLTNGQWFDGRTGKANILTNARGVQFLGTELSPYIPAITEGLEQSIRESGGAAGLFGGMNPTALRTGRAIDAMGSFSVDPRVEEAQRIMAATLACLNEGVLAVEKGYAPRKKFFAFTGLQGDERVVSYTPAEDFDALENAVSYPIPGADISQVSVAIAQLVGSGLMSKKTGRVKHPLIDDPNFEDAQIEEEAMRAAVLAAANQQAAQGAMPLVDAARILDLLNQGTPIEKAVLQAHQEAQARQATQAPPPQTGQVSSPQAQPGLSAPGAGAEQPSATTPISPGPPSLANFHTLIRNLNSRPEASPTGGPPGA